MVVYNDSLEAIILLNTANLVAKRLHTSNVNLEMGFSIAKDTSKALIGDHFGPQKEAYTGIYSMVACTSAVFTKNFTMKEI